MEELTNKALNPSEDSSSMINSLLQWSTDAGMPVNTQDIPGASLLSGFSIETIIVGMLASIIWIYYVKIGKKDGKITTLLCGIALLGITYFIKNVRYLIGTALVLAIIPIVKKD